MADKLASVSASSPSPSAEKNQPLRVGGLTVGGIVNAGVIGGVTAAVSHNKGAEDRQFAGDIGTQVAKGLGFNDADAKKISSVATSRTAREDIAANAIKSATGVSDKTFNTAIQATKGNEAAQRKLLVGAAASVVQGTKLGDFANTKYGQVRDIKKDLKGLKGEKPTQEITSIEPRLATYSRLAVMKSRNDPLMAFDFQVRLPTDFIAATGIKNFTAEFITEDVTINLPNIPSNPVFRAGTQLYYPGISDVGTCSITCYEDNRLTTARYFEYWHKLVQNPSTGLYNDPAAYKKTFDILILDAQWNTIGKYIVHGAWPTQRSAAQFSSASNERVTYQVDFSVDNISFEYYDPVTPYSYSSTSVQQLGVNVDKNQQLRASIKTGLNATNKAMNMFGYGIGGYTGNLS